MSGTKEQRRRQLDARAALAAIRTVAESAAGHESFAAFLLGGYRVGVPLLCVSRTAYVDLVTPIPGGPHYLLGVATWDGQLVSLLDLLLFLDLKRRGGGDIVAGVVIKHENRKIALAAEQLLGIEDLPSDSISVLPVNRRPFSRTTRVNGMDTVLLDVAALMSDPRLSGRDETPDANFDANGT